MSKNIKTIVWIIVAAVLVLVLVWGVMAKGNLFNGVWNVSNSNEQGIKATEFKADAAGISKINLEFISEEIEVVFTNEKEIRLEQTSDTALDEDDMMLCSVDGNTLRAKSGLANDGFDFFSWFDNMKYQNIKVELFVPSSYSEGLSLSTVSGSINLQEGTLNDLRVNSTSGSIMVADTNSKKLIADSISGSVYVNGGQFGEIKTDNVSGEVRVDVQSLEEIKNDTVSGSIFIASKTMPSNIEVDGVSGSVTLQLPENDGFVLNHDAVSGSVMNDFEMKNNVYKNGDNTIEIDLVSGSTSIVKQ